MLVVRLAAPVELTTVGELTVAAYLADGLLDGPSDAYADRLRDAASRFQQAELWVVELDGSLAGSVTFCPNGSLLSELALPGEGEFRMLAVDPARRGQGAALALVQQCLTRSRELGYDAMVLSSLPGMAAAHRLYERVGFRRTPARDWSPVPGVQLWAFTLWL